jgi:hypothetical protein
VLYEKKKLQVFCEKPAGQTCVLKSCANPELPAFSFNNDYTYPMTKNATVLAKLSKESDHL